MRIRSRPPRVRDKIPAGKQVEIVGHDLNALLTDVRTLIQHLNQSYEISFTPTGRLKVVNIPVSMGDAAKQEENVVTAVTRLLVLLETLIGEIRETRQVLQNLGQTQP